MRSAVLFITWACNYKCPYCWELQSGYKPDKMKSSQEWVDALNRLNLDILDISGGEPFLQHGLIDIINEVNCGRIALTSNLSHGVNELIEKVSPEKLFSITASYHPTQGVTIDSFKEKVEALRLNGFRVSVNFVMYPDQMRQAEEVHQAFGGVHFDRYIPTEFAPYEPNEEERAFINSYVGSDRPEQHEQEGIKFCTGGQYHFNIQPDGEVFRCIEDKQLGKPCIGNLFSEEFTPNDASTPCEDWWRCLGCDRDKVVLTEQEEQSQARSLNLQAEQESCHQRLFRGLQFLSFLWRADGRRKKDHR